MSFRTKSRNPVASFLGNTAGSFEPGWELARELCKCLVDKGWHPGLDLAYLEVKGADHSEAAWAARVEPALRFLFPARK